MATEDQADVSAERRSRVGHAFRAYREQAGFDRDGAAKELGVSRKTIERIEGGLFFPSFKTLDKAADIFRAPLDELAGRAELTAKPPISLRATTEGSADRDSLATAHDGIAALGDALGTVLEVLATVPGLSAHAVEQLRLASEKLPHAPDEQAS